MKNVICMVLIIISASIRGYADTLTCRFDNVTEAIIFNTIKGRIYFEHDGLRKRTELVMSTDEDLGSIQIETDLGTKLYIDYTQNAVLSEDRISLPYKAQLNGTVQGGCSVFRMFSKDLSYERLGSYSNINGSVVTRFWSGPNKKNFGYRALRDAIIPKEEVWDDIETASLSKENCTIKEDKIIMPSKKESGEQYVTVRPALTLTAKANTIINENFVIRAGEKVTAISRLADNRCLYEKSGAPFAQDCKLFDVLKNKLDFDTVDEIKNADGTTVLPAGYYVKVMCFNNLEYKWINTKSFEKRLLGKSPDFENLLSAFN